MRHGKFGWCAAIVLAAMASVSPSWAAAPPCQARTSTPQKGSPSLPPDYVMTCQPRVFFVYRSVPSDTEVRSWVSGECGTEQWKLPPSRQQRETIAKAGSVREGCLAEDSLGSATREVTIVVRIKEGIGKPADAMPRCPFRRKVALPSRQAVVRSLRAQPGGFVMGWAYGRLEFDSDPSPSTLDEEANAVLASLKDKVLELHEPGVFELAVDGLGTDRAKVTINYEPVEPPPEPIDFKAPGDFYFGGPIF